jgi:MFS family permease
MGGVRDELIDSRAALAQVFRSRNLRRVNLALVGSVIGDWAFSVAFSIYVYQQGGAAALGIVGVIRYLTMAILAPFAAVLADRFDRRLVMVAADVVRAVLVLAAAGVVAADGAPVVVYVLSILTGYVGLAFRPAQAALLPNLARTPAELTAANVAASTINSIGFFVGPALAGGLLAISDIPSVFVLDALTFVWSAAMVVGIRTVAPADEAVPDAEAAGDPQGGDGDESTGMSEGFKVILRSRELRLIAMLFVVQTIVAGCSLVYEVAIALDLLDMGESGVGVLNAALGIGGIVGGLAALLLAQRGGMARNFGLGVAMWGAPLLLVAAFPSPLSAIVAMMLIGLANSVVDVNAETIVQRLVPNEVLGRVFGALESAVIGGMAIGAGLMPLLIATIGLRSGLVVIGVVTSGLVAIGIPGLMRIDRITLAPEGIELVRGVPMLSVLPERLIDRLARLSEVIEFPAGTAVFAEGDPGDRFYIVERGEADVSRAGVVVGEVTAGGSFGEIALIRDIPRTATVTARTDLTVRAIERRHFLPAVTGDPSAFEQAELTVGRFLPNA